jgi:hypothetical protein
VIGKRSHFKGCIAARLLIQSLIKVFSIIM